MTTNKPTSIKEIQATLAAATTLSPAYLADLKADPRKGVAQLLARYERQQAKQAQLQAQAEQMLNYERIAQQQGFQAIAGLDEVGRGPLAGPVVAAAVILPAELVLLEVNDSKQLSAAKREELFTLIQAQALAIGVGIVSETVIDQINIYQATKQAMMEALEQLAIPADYLLLDALNLEKSPLPQVNLIKGDAKSVSIAAASIIAKVTRDRLMADYDQQFPGYGFARNAGYGTAAHLAGLAELGPCPIHRRSFAPIKELLN